ncbi:uncharacterized protein N7483_010782 [Penicillium malachiteum]|uniref:uncharacterized protein n=1 Tax=Penicillium malachiteum TaxID=1324776 RepID=UPI002548804E|nr:uncharacterized protein N7483_010782 [Penicillium malachiteum]KAJ5713601.1 hypothetical protein N7483_010782 [Penicillium malachiteum]
MATHTVLRSCRQYLELLGNRCLRIEKDKDYSLNLQPSPYLYINKSFKPVYRLCDDTHRTFLTAVKPKLNSDHAPFTAEVVQLLVKQGAVVVGLTKLSSMIGREEPLEAVDFQISFNPRGDGYQSPAGNSNGSVACVAAYDWIDCAIGTDSSGSGRRPAMANGVWQFRPSHNLISLSGMVRTCSRFDKPVVFARSFSILKATAQVWISKSINPTPCPKEYNIIYPFDYLPVENTEQMQLIDSFVEDMRAALPAKITKFSIREAWKRSHPPETPEDFDDYPINTVERVYYYVFYHSFTVFREKYAEKHDRKPPYVLPSLQYRWEKGAAVSEEEHKDAVQRMNTYKEWLLNVMLAESTSEAEILVVLPIANAAPNYRDEPSPSPLWQSALDQLFLPPILGAPDIAIPTGEVSYVSKITKRTEYLPVVIDIMGAPTKNLELLQAIEKTMVLSGRPASVTTGSRVFQS